MITLPIEWHTDETRDAEKLGIPYDESKIISVPMTFLRIDAFKASENNPDHTAIYLTDQIYITKIREPEVKAMIAEWLKTRGY